jgi:hypothetical protein
MTRLNANDQRAVRKNEFRIMKDASMKKWKIDHGERNMMFTLKMLKEVVDLYVPMPQLMMLFV